MVKEEGLSWQDLLEAFNEVDIEFFELESREDKRTKSIVKSITVSFNALDEDLKKRFIEMAIFSGDIKIPEIVVNKLWGYTAKIKPRNSKIAINKLKRKSLLKIMGEPPYRTIEFHDLIHVFYGISQKIK